MISVTAIQQRKIWVEKKSVQIKDVTAIKSTWSNFVRIQHLPSR